MIEDAYAEAARLGLALWTEDEAGPYQTVPYPGESWYEGSQPVCLPHEYVRNGTAKLLTLFEPATGQLEIPPIRWTGKAQSLQKELPVCPKPIPPTTLLSARERSIYF